MAASRTALLFAENSFDRNNRGVFVGMIDYGGFEHIPIKRMMELGQQGTLNVPKEGKILFAINTEKVCIVFPAWILSHPLMQPFAQAMKDKGIAKWFEF